MNLKLRLLGTFKFSLFLFLLLESQSLDVLSNNSTDPLPAPAANNNVAVELTGNNNTQAKTVIQYSLSLPCEGWVTSAITLTGQIINQPVNSAFSPVPIIDAELLKEYGCQLKAGRILSRGQRKIIMEAYQFATSDGAFGAYGAVHRGSTSYLTQGDASSEDQDSICFCKDRYFIYLYSTAQDDDEAKSTINQIATKLSNYIKPIVVNPSAATQTPSLPEIFRRLPNLERVPGSEKLVMGPVALKKFFPAPYNTILSTLTKAAVSDYKVDYPDRDRLKLLLADYSSIEQAKSVFTNYVDTLRSNNKEKEVEVFTYPTALFKVGDYFLLCQLRNKTIILVNGARHKDSPGDLVHRVYF